MKLTAETILKLVFEIGWPLTEKLIDKMRNEPEEELDWEELRSRVKPLSAYKPDA